VSADGATKEELGSLMAGVESATTAAIL